MTNFNLEIAELYRLGLISREEARANLANLNLSASVQPASEPTQAES